MTSSKIFRVKYNSIVNNIFLNEYAWNEHKSQNCLNRVIQPKLTFNPLYVCLKHGYELEWNYARKGIRQHYSTSASGQKWLFWCVLEFVGVCFLPVGTHHYSESRDVTCPPDYKRGVKDSFSRLVYPCCLWYWYFITGYMCISVLRITENWPSLYSPLVVVFVIAYVVFFLTHLCFRFQDF